MKINEYLEIRESSIHHKGGFALKDIPKDTHIIEYTGRKITKEEGERISKETYEESKSNNTKGAIYMFELDENYYIDGDTEDNYAKYINHSCDPNCETDIFDGHIWIYAIKDIKKGEELTFDYCFELDDIKDKFDINDFICKCGSHNCSGYIVSEEDRPKLKEFHKILK